MSISNELIILMSTSTSDESESETENTFEVVINACYGGFRVPEGILKCHDDHDYHRNCPELIKYVKNGGTGGEYSRLKIKHVPIEYENYWGAWGFDEYDGKETIWWDPYVLKRMKFKEKLKGINTYGINDLDVLRDLVATAKDVI